MFCSLDSTALYLQHMIEVSKYIYEDKIDNKIKELDERTGGSLKFKLLNPNGNIWLLVAGGGATLFYAARVLENLKALNEDQQAGVNIVKKAMQSPIRQIAENAGVDGAIVVGKLEESKSNTMGFDAQSMEYVDMFKAGIIDPTKVVRTALIDAASVASLIITTEAIIIADPTVKEDSQSGGGMPSGMGMGGMGGMGF